MIDDDVTEPRSLFVVVSYPRWGSMSSSIVQLGRQVVNNCMSGMIPVTSDSIVFSAHIRQQFKCLPTGCAFSCTDQDLYMVPDDARLHGYKFNFRTNELNRIKRPLSSQIIGKVVSLRDRIYRMPDHCWISAIPEPSFQRYNPVDDSWEPLKPLLFVCEGATGRILATAVWDDTILMNIDKNHIWAYNGGRDEWYSVYVEDKYCYGIEGEAVVVENKTIYALTRGYSETILALSVKIEEKNNGDLAYTCSLLSKISVLVRPRSIVDEEVGLRTRHLVHLGKDNFCLVQSCELSDDHPCQPIQVTYLKNLRGQNTMIVTEICVHWMVIESHAGFQVRLCFSLPCCCCCMSLSECKTTAALKQGKKEPDVFDFDPRISFKVYWAISKKILKKEPRLKKWGQYMVDMVLSCPCINAHLQYCLSIRAPKELT